MTRPTGEPGPRLQSRTLRSPHWSGAFSSNWYPRMTPSAASSARSAICARKSATSPPEIVYRGRTCTGAANDAALPRYQYPAVFHEPRCDLGSKARSRRSAHRRRQQRAIGPGAARVLCAAHPREPARCAAARYRGGPHPNVVAVPGAGNVGLNHDRCSGDQGRARSVLLGRCDRRRPARALGCRELYSEDMTHGREIERVTIINPFR